MRPAFLSTGTDRERPTGCSVSRVGMLLRTGSLRESIPAHEEGLVSDGRATEVLKPVQLWEECLLP